eukprot:10512117-Alexandrium_andersonii.AAC.1
MSFQHEIISALHHNVQTALRREGYPITWNDFRKAWTAAFPSIRARIEKHLKCLTTPLTASRLSCADVLSAE